MTELSRIEREKAFHNTEFSESKRHPAFKYYSVATSSFAYYDAFLKANCADKLFLEYGCGSGSRAFMLARGGAKVLGIDISDVGIKQAQEEAKKEHLTIEFRVMNAEILELPDSTFDIACGTAILHHLDIAKSLGELARVLKPHGDAIFLEPLGHNPLIQLYRKVTPQLRTPDEHPLTVKDLLEIKKQFEVVEMRYFCFTTLFAVPLRKLPFFFALMALLNRFDQLLFSLIPSLRKYAWIVVIILKNHDTKR
jgi:SAM-dependent methyltransferase